MPKSTRKPQRAAKKLKDIQGTVRQMMCNASGAATNRHPGGRVVVGRQGEGTYVGATHFMTILDDLEDLKQFFDESDSNDDDGLSPDNISDDRIAGLFMLSEDTFKSKRDLLDLLPPWQVLDRLVVRYFTWHPPSSHVIHRPWFNRQYHIFRQNRNESSYEFLALLFMILAQATLFSNFSAPEEVGGDSPVPPMDRVKSYRSAGLCALAAADYTSPTLQTIPPLLLHLEAEFVLSHSTPMKCYLLSSTCIRLMLRLGLHRDPSRLPGITVFWGEMRRRMWHFGLQIEMLVSFQMGLPSSSSGIESDTKLPSNLTDEDFDESASVLPASRPDSEHGPLTYFNWKTTLGQVFRSIAKQAHSLAAVSDSEVMQLDVMLEDAWHRVPSFLKVRPLEQCITDEPLLVMERFSLCSIYHKSRCVLHRRYLLEGSSGPHQEYSRHSCLRSALALLEFQKMHYEATRPGAMLAQFTWFLRPIIIGDFLLAAMIVYIALQSEFNLENAESKEEPLPNRQGLYQILVQSQRIWTIMANEDSDFRKPAKMLSTMVTKAERYRDSDSRTPQLSLDGSSSSGHALQDNPISQTNDIPAEDGLDFNTWLSLGDNFFDWQNFDRDILSEGQPQLWTPRSAQLQELPYLDPSVGATYPY